MPQTRSSWTSCAPGSKPRAGRAALTAPRGPSHAGRAARGRAARDRAARDRGRSACRPQAPSSPLLPPRTAQTRQMWRTRCAGTHVRARRVAPAAGGRGRARAGRARAEGGARRSDRRPRFGPYFSGAGFFAGAFFAAGSSKTSASMASYPSACGSPCSPPLMAYSSSGESTSCLRPQIANPARITT
jgi:hypothetical protein